MKLFLYAMRYSPPHHEETVIIANDRRDAFHMINRRVACLKADMKTSLAQTRELAHLRVLLDALDTEGKPTNDKLLISERTLTRGVAFLIP